MGVNIRYEHLTIVYPHSPSPTRGKTADVRNDKYFDRMDCKYCYTDDIQPVTLYENVLGQTCMAICPNCGYGLTPSEDAPAELTGLIRSIEEFDLRSRANGA